MGSSSSKVQQRQLEVQQAQAQLSHYPPAEVWHAEPYVQPPPPPRPRRPDPEYHSPPPPYELLGERIGRFNPNGRRADVFNSPPLPMRPARPTFTPYQQPPPRPSQYDHGPGYDSDEDAEMIQFVAQMSLEDHVANTHQPRARPSQPNLSTPRQPRAQASQPNFSRRRPASPVNAQPRRQASSADVNAPRQPRQRASQPELTGPNALHRRITSAVSGSEAYENLVQLRGGRKRRHHHRIDEAEEPVTGPTQECAICVEEKPLKDFPAMTGKCKHKATTCSTCVRTWIKGELNAMTWDKLKCIGTGCKCILQHGDVRRLAEREVFEKYDKFATLSVLSRMPNFRWCIGPRCTSGQLHTTGTDGPIFTCSECRFKHCTIHNVAWHAGLTCREYDYAQNPALKKKEEEASEKAIRELSRRCPGRGCGAPIQRNGGCDHMTCTKCKHEFCWLCYADYKDIRKKGNTAHKTTCRLHTRNLT